MFLHVFMKVGHHVFDGTCNDAQRALVSEAHRHGGLSHGAQYPLHVIH